MAKIEFTGFVQKHEGNRPWEIAENHRKQEDGKWVTKSTTYHKVWLPDGITELPIDTLVTVVGRQVTPPKKDDHKPTPIIYADTITDHLGNAIGQPIGEPAAEPTTDPDWAATYPDTDLPF